MAKFRINQPVTTTVPQVIVDAGLPPGQHRFQLVVQDDTGNASAPDIVVVTIVPNTRRERLMEENRAR